MNIKIIAFLLLLQTFLFSQAVGSASWYGKKFQGKTTASGEPFNMYAYTAAHKTLPFGTIVTVTNLKNAKSIDVKINDRLPYTSNRIIDISFQSAKLIGLVRMGTTTVSIMRKKVSTLKSPIVASTKLVIYTASSADLSSMMEYALSMTDSKKNVAKPMVPSVKKNVKVQIASFATENGAKEFIVKERSKGYKMGIISLYSDVLKQVRHKVVILTNSKVNAVSIVNSKQYNGAYILR